MSAPYLLSPTPLNRDDLEGRADSDRAEILFESVDELAVRGKIDDLLVDDPVAPGLRRAAGETETE